MFPKRLFTVGSTYAYAPPSFCAIDGEGGEDAGAGGAVATPIEQPFDENAALARLSGLLQAEERDQNSGEGRDNGDGESHPTGEEEGQSETQETASIEPPKSWSDEEKAVFGKLPPEHQAIVAHRESERDKVITQRTQEAAETRKAAEAERAGVQNQRAEYVKNLQALAALAVPDAQQFQNVDWAKLAADNPAEYVRLRGMRDAVSERLQVIQGEFNRVQQQQAIDHAKWLQDVNVEQAKKLVERMPEFGDELKASKLRSDISNALHTHYGFALAEIGETRDHRLVMVAADATKWRQAEAARKSAESKATPAKPPRVQQPGAAQQRDGNSQQVRDLRGQFAKSGSVEHGAALLRALGLAT